MKFIIVLCLFFQGLSLTAYAQAYKYHTVAPEENVFRIAQKYGISTEAIYKYNPDARNGVNVGSKLVIPIQDETGNAPGTPAAPQAVTFIDHKVQRQETIYRLSKQYEVSEEDIKRYNKQLYSKELQLGETIKIPVFSKSAVRETRTTPAQPSRPVQITNTREHIILPKETKYGIARKYGMTVNELESLNPTVDVLQPGIMLKVGTNVLDEPVIITGDDFQFYEVQPQETLFGLTQRFQVSQDSLIALNPALKDGLKFGMVLKVPTKDARGRELEDIEIPVAESFEKRSADLSNSLKDFSTKNLVLMLPFNTSKVNKDTISNSRGVLQNDRVMRISLDFYSGVLMALETAKEMGISTNLKVYDTQQQPGTVSSIIQNNNFNNVHAVIGPLFQATSEEAASRLLNQNIPVISPISNRELRGMPNLYQARPSDEMLTDAMINYLRDNSQGKNIIIIADSKNSAVKSKLMNALPNARLVNPAGNNVSSGAISPSLMSDRENWIILESESVALLGSATSAMYRLARGNRIKLFTTNKNSSYDSDIIVNEHLGRLEFHYPSEYKEFDETVTDRFIDTYKSKYGVVPNNYTVRGYDLTLDVLLRLGAMSTLERSVKENIETEYVENKFLYRPKQNGGFSNNAVYIMKLNNDLTLSVAN
ncbi:LysM peptidoglycan-binding domain-containing protein [Antarcticibacterium arcticum]|uniref:LysM peptidoglycan-binding domain-containing protein n=1 Tax=Antarcticibacterium arcticum TaxID=2585771 RepID=A0A5B8YML7_9FLAO|nr:LysM peptidoglycan-binding domain-containing protein [Antarcticibacterium arcticum]QED37496.1 LysM peptidoglycan-binding domain-containing protein [Antarcticibacterium arcticum]